jgi:hypothetical protein
LRTSRCAPALKRRSARTAEKGTYRLDRRSRPCRSSVHCDEARDAAFVGRRT